MADLMDADVNAAVARVTAWARGFSESDFDPQDVLLVVEALHAARRAASPVPGEPELAAIKARADELARLYECCAAAGATWSSPDDEVRDLMRHLDAHFPAEDAYALLAALSQRDGIIHDMQQDSRLYEQGLADGARRQFHADLRIVLGLAERSEEGTPYYSAYNKAAYEMSQPLLAGGGAAPPPLPPDQARAEADRLRAEMRRAVALADAADGWIMPARLPELEDAVRIIRQALN